MLILGTAFAAVVNWAMEHVPPWLGLTIYFILMGISIWLIIRYFKKSLKK